MAEQSFPSRIGIGIDTGGTCTDALVYEFATGTILATGKAATTREDLSWGIGTALDSLPSDLLHRADIIMLSTTLATNACVEGKGGRAKLLLIGTPQQVLTRIDAEHDYGLQPDDVLCVPCASSFDGRIAEEPDWETLFTTSADWFAAADALSVAELYATHNGAVRERFAKTLLTERFDVPVICGHEVADELNMIERGTTALLNARLLPLVSGFMNAVEEALAARGVRAPVMIVRSDGSLMSEELGRIRPVETILSGPAASALGGTGLAGKQGRDCLVIDMGGTTTDISITREGVPTLSTTGIRIAGWRTQVKGVSVETYALGGDSVLRLVDGRLMLAAQRVLPMCVAASRWPVVREALRGVLATARRHSLPLHEFLSLVHKPADSGRFTVRENALVKTLVDGPLNVEAAATAVGTDIYQLGSERLEAEGIILRCGLTPTDLMHIRGDFTAYDTEAAVLVARCLLRCQVRLADDDEGLQTLAEEGYDLMKRTLYAHVVRTVLAAEHPGLFADGPDAQLDFLISQAWGQWREGMPTSFIDILPHIGATLVGIGAPIHIFLPEVAEALGARCVIPEHSEAANALGAVISSISATAKVEISSYSAEDGQGGYRIHGPQGTERYDTLEIAIAAAESAAAQAAEAEARRRGATGFLTVETEVDPQSISDSEGRTTIFGFTVHAVASPVQGVDADIAGLPRHRFTYPTRTSSG